MRLGGADDLGQFFVKLCGKAALINGFEGLIKVCHLDLLAFFGLGGNCCFLHLGIDAFFFQRGDDGAQGLGQFLLRQCFLRLFAGGFEKGKHRLVGTVVAFFGFGFAFFSAFAFEKSRVDACGAFSGCPPPSIFISWQMMS